MTKTLLPLCALLLLPATSFAAPASGPGSYVNDEGATVSQNGDVREIVVIDGDSIEGDSLHPGGTAVTGSRHGKLESMISVRTEFITQLILLSADI